MFITEDQARQRLSSPDNLANRFNLAARRVEQERSINATGHSREARIETEAAESGQQEKESGSIQSLPAGAINCEQVEHRSIPRTGRRGPWLSVEERTEIAIDAKISGRKQETIAQEHGISRQAVAQIHAGLGLRDESEVAHAIEIARNKALDRLMASLGLLTDDKLSGCKATDLANIAANMSRVVEKTMPDKDRQGNINLIVYTPEIRSEKSFEVVEI